MTLAKWSTDFAIPIERHHTGGTLVYCTQSERPRAYVALFGLSDYAVSTVSGPVVWLTPRRFNH